MSARRLSPKGHRGDASMESGLRGSHGIAGAAMLLYCVLACGEESAVTGEASRPPLDLRAPDIEDVLTPQQIADALGSTREGNIEEIEVEGVRTRRRRPRRTSGWRSRPPSGRCCTRRRRGGFSPLFRLIVRAGSAPSGRTQPRASANPRPASPEWPAIKDHAAFVRKSPTLIETVAQSRTAVNQEAL